MALQLPQIQRDTALSQAVLLRKPEQVSAPISGFIPESPTLAVLKSRPDLLIKKNQSTLEKLADFGKTLGFVSSGLAGVTGLIEKGIDFLEKRAEKQAIKNTIGNLDPNSATAIQAIDNIIKEQAERGILDTDELKNLLNLKKNLEELGIRQATLKSLESTRKADTLATAARVGALGAGNIAQAIAEIGQGIGGNIAEQKITGDLSKIEQDLQSLAERAKEARAQKTSNVSLGRYLSLANRLGIEGANRLLLLEGVPLETVNQLEQTASAAFPEQLATARLTDQANRIFKETIQQTPEIPEVQGAQRTEEILKTAANTAAKLFPNSPLKEVVVTTRTGKRIRVKIRVPKELLLRFTLPNDIFDINAYIAFIFSQAQSQGTSTKPEIKAPNVGAPQSISDITTPEL